MHPHEAVQHAIHDLRTRGLYPAPPAAEAPSSSPGTARARAYLAALRRSLARDEAAALAPLGPEVDR
ncbi:MAG TPA: hypothetical protein VEQ60_08730 [Longimicrobium sp.]|nr:hypothetical protein [Longimicrobium sp.]